MAEKSSLDQANIRQKLGLVWRNRKKISQIIKDYFYLPFFLNYFMLDALAGKSFSLYISCHPSQGIMAASQGERRQPKR
jgi:hypothetical protein